MGTSAELVVLNFTKFGENSIVLHTLSREYGRRGFLIRGVGKKTSMSLFLPLNIVEADITENPKSSLWFAKNVMVRYPLIGIRNNMYKNSMTMFMSEVLYRVIREGSNEEGLFDWCVRSILTLDAIESDFGNYHIRFLLEFANALGFSPNFEGLMPFLSKSQFVDRNLIDRFLQSSFSETMLIKLNGEQRNELAGHLIKYIEFHTESAVNVKSLAVLRELYI